LRSVIFSQSRVNHTLREMHIWISACMKDHLCDLCSCVESVFQYDIWNYRNRVGTVIGKYVETVYNEIVQVA
jgi:hypothetical protein